MELQIFSFCCASLLKFDCDVDYLAATLTPTIAKWPEAATDGVPYYHSIIVYIQYMQTYLYFLGM